MPQTSSRALNVGRTSSIICAAGAFGIYLLTLAPKVQSFDSAELTVGAYALGFVHAPGYPLYMLLGHGFAKWLPFGDVGMQLNLMSAVFAGLTVLVLWRMIQDSLPGFHTVPVVWLFAATPIFWSQALRAEVYTLHAFLMTSALYLWRSAHRSGQPFWYVVCFLVLGLGMGNHPTALLLWGTLLICLIWEPPPFRRLGVGATVLGVVIAGMIYLYFPLRSPATLSINYIQTYFRVNLDSLTGLWWLFSARMFQSAFYLDRDLTLAVQEALRFGTLLWNNLLGVGVVLGVYGWWRLRQQDALWNRLLSIYFAANLMSYICYHVIDKEVMFIPAFVIWSIWTAHGAKGLSDWLVQQIGDVPASTVRAISSAALLLLVGLGIVFNWRAVSLRDNRKAYDFAAQVLKHVEPSALVVNYWVTASVLDYLRIVEGHRPDVESFNMDFYNLALQEKHGSLESAEAQNEWFDFLERELGRRPICFIEPLPPVPERYRWANRGICWNLVPTPQDQLE